MWDPFRRSAAPPTGTADLVRSTVVRIREMSIPPVSVLIPASRESLSSGVLNFPVAGVNYSQVGAIMANSWAPIERVCKRNRSR